MPRFQAAAELRLKPAHASPLHHSFYSYCCRVVKGVQLVLFHSYCYRHFARQTAAHQLNVLSCCCLQDAISCAIPSRSALVLQLVVFTRHSTWLCLSCTV
jgi:hypothetical protein